MARNYVLLDRTYRLDALAAAFPSAEFYAGRLVAAAPERPVSELFPQSVCYLDTSGLGLEEERGGGGPLAQLSAQNPGEAALAARAAAQLLAAGLQPAELGAISPYAAQVALLRQALPAGVEAATVDGFQGREKEAIILSLVRSNDAGEAGFVGDPRRLNVSVTRARRLLLVIGDLTTLGADPLLGRYAAWLYEHGAPLAEEDLG